MGLLLQNISRNRDLYVIVFIPLFAFLLLRKIPNFISFTTPKFIIIYSFYLFIIIQCIISNILLFADKLYNSWMQQFFSNETTNLSIFFSNIFMSIFLLIFFQSLYFIFDHLCFLFFFNVFFVCFVLAIFWNNFIFY